MFSLKAFLLLLVLLQSTYAHPRNAKTQIKNSQDCVVPLESLIKDHPLYLQPESTKDVLPDSNGQIVLPAGASIELSCPASSDSLNTATCRGGTKFEIKGKVQDLTQVACSSKPTNIARFTGKTCEGNSLQEIEIGFEIDNERFKRTITICFNDTIKSPAYSYFDLPSVATAVEANVARPSFVEDDFYNLDAKLNNLYTKTSQKKILNKQLGLSESSTKYISTGNFYLAKGHLTAKADFIYAPQQGATFHYVNTAPQWQGFNSVNWFAAESNARTYAESRNVSLKVYTGIDGILKYPNEETGEDTPLYLYSTTSQLIPVPETFWKLLYEPKSQAAVVILGINNPYLDPDNVNTICNDISQQLDFLTMDQYKIEAGYTYACSYNDFKKAVKLVPKLVVKKLLV